MKVKYIGYLLICFLVSYGCKSKEKIKVDTEMAQGPNSQVENSLKEEVPLGSWLSKKYAEALLDNLSPYKCASKYDEVTELNIAGDEVSLVYRNTEGVKSAFYLDTLDGISLNMEDGTVLSKVGDELRLKNDKNRQMFIQVETPPAPQSILNHFVMARLFAGTYKGINGKVKIDVNGKVKGLDTYTELKVFTRFDELGDFDMLALTNPAGDTTYFGWEIQDGVIVLYHLVPGTSYLYEKGEEWLRLALIEAVG